MALPNVFTEEVTTKIIHRIHALTPESKAKWGVMNVGQLLAHCNVTYEMTFEDIHPKPNAFIKFILKLLVKNKVVSELPYTQNSQTAPQFIITETKEFEHEKQRLINYILKTKDLGEPYFDQRESHSFGVLASSEWNNMFYKHLDHHLTQFGV